MRKIVGIVIVLLVSLYVADTLFLGLAERRLTGLARSAAPDASEIHTTIGKPLLRIGDKTILHKPVIFDILTGRLPSAEIRLLDVTAGQVPIDEVVVRVDGVEIDGSLLLRNHRLAVKKLKGASVTLDTSAAALSTITSRPVKIRNGAIIVSTPIGKVPATVLVTRDRRLVITPAGGAPQTFRIADDKILPCTPTAKVRQPSLTLSCSVTKVPNHFLGM